jgi:hypothetical protein
MIQTFDPRRVDAFTQLLAIPLPKDLPLGGHVYRCEGDPERRTTRLPAIIMGWLQRRHLAVDIEEPPARPRTFVRRGRSLNPGLRVLRPTGTG